MLINFNQHLFKTKLDCSAVSLDGYSPNNLLSSNWRERHQGFMAAHFIKPPVFLLFQFAFPIQIHSIAIKPKVGSQISTGFDFFVAGVKPKAMENAFCVKKGRKSCEVNEQQHQQQQQQKVTQKTNHRKRKCDHLDDKSSTKDDNFDGKLHVPKKEKIHKIPEPNYNTTVTIESFKNSHRNLFTLVSRINELSGKIIRIVNRRYIGTDGSCTYEGAIEYDFFHVNDLSYVTHLMLVVSRVKGSCVPCLGMIEIWGKPSVYCNKDVIGCVYEIQKQINGHIHERSTTKTKQNLMETHTTKNDDVITDDDDDDIPNDFRDPITCNLMTIPMLLPSGLNIDLTTLEKHSEAERRWGRMPSDPFTGVVFTSTVKPIANSALKVRIDKYILSSGVDVNSYGRTVGRMSNQDKQDRQTAVTMINKSKVNNGRMDGKSPYSNVGSSKRNDGDGLNSEPLHANEGSNHCGTITTKIKDVESHVKVIQSHEEQISTSLDDALMKTLQGATFTRRQPTVDAASISSLVQEEGVSTPSTTTTTPSMQSVVKTQKPKTCICCKVALDTAFQLPCQHLLCRKCLLLKCSSSKKPICSLCKCSFLRHEAVRVHTV